MSRIIRVIPTTRFESDRRYGRVQAELAHASQVATMRQQTAPIAHDLNNSISATIMNAETALRWLEQQPPDVAKVHQAINRIVANGKRAADVVGELRELAKKARHKRSPWKSTK